MSNVRDSQDTFKFHIYSQYTNRLNGKVLSIFFESDSYLTQIFFKFERNSNNSLYVYKSNYSNVFFNIIIIILPIYKLFNNEN